MNQRSDFEQPRTKFGSYLKDLLKRRWGKQKNAAAELGVSEQQLSQYVNGKRTTPDNLLTRLAEECNVPLEEIMIRKYWPQLHFLTGIIAPAELVGDLRKELLPTEKEELTRYAAFLLLRRHAGNKS